MKVEGNYRHRPWWKRNLNVKYTNKEFLYEEYVINKKPTTQIAKEQNTTANTILRWINIHKLPISPHKEYYRVNLIGKRFGKLVVIEEYKEPTECIGGIKWACLCDCGNKAIIRGKFLKSGDRTNCGCSRSNFQGWHEISLSFFNRLKRASKKRKLAFNIDIKYLWELFLKQNRKCIYSKELLYLDANDQNQKTTASLDRIDSSKGYILGNVQWVHKEINRLKGSLLSVISF